MTTDPQDVVADETTTTSGVYVHNDNGSLVQADDPNYDAAKANSDAAIRENDARNGFDDNEAGPTSDTANWSGSSNE